MERPPARRYGGMRIDEGSQTKALSERFGHNGGRGHIELAADSVHLDCNGHGAAGFRLPVPS